MNDFKPPFQNNTTLIDIFYQRAASQPEKVAYIFLQDGEAVELRLTYAELNRRVRVLASHLQKLVKSGSRALLLYPPGLDFIIAFYACLSAGIIAVPTYPVSTTKSTHMVARLKAILQDATPSLVLTTSVMQSQVQDILDFLEYTEKAHVIPTDTIKQGVSGWYAPRPERDTLAFLQYTSGSTGTPRGVMVSHVNLLHNLAEIQRGFVTHADSLGVIWLPPYHDMGLIGGILQPLYSGFPVVLFAPAAFLQRPVRWLRAISRYRATVSGGPNFAYELCSQKISQEQKDGLNLSSWSLAFNGAEPVRASTLELFSSRYAAYGFRRQAFYPCYGLAEATLLVTGRKETDPPQPRIFDNALLSLGSVREVAFATKGSRTLVGCGQPIDKQQILIVHPETKTPCTANEIGEIWITGPSVAQGYWQRNEESQQVFGQHQENIPEKDFLCTGDLGFIYAGELFITGRIKDLIIIRGRNHSASDIEETVEKCNPELQIGASAAFALEREDTEHLVLACEIKRQYRTTDMKKLVKCIREGIAEEHGIHAYAVLILKPGRIPKTSSGKVQRYLCHQGFLDGSLPLLYSSILQDETITEEVFTLNREMVLSYDEQSTRQTLLERYLQTQIANIASIASHTIEKEKPLTSLGLDSLMVFELLHRIEHDFQIEIPVTKFLEGTCIVQLAQHLVDSLQQKKVALPLQRYGAIEAPLSFAQERFWFLEQLSSEKAVHSIPVAIKMQGKLQVAALQQSLNEIIRRHETLRSVFRMVEGQLRSCILPSLECTIQVRDVHELAAQEESIARLLQKEARTPFDLQQGPLLRATLFAVWEEEHILLLVLHHIITDGWSMGILLQELKILYTCSVTDTTPKLPELVIQYSDYIRWQREYLQETHFKSHAAFWQKYLSDAPGVLEFPTDRPRLPVQRFRGALYPFLLDARLLQRCKELSQKENCTLFVTLLSIFAILICNYTAQNDFIIGTPTVNRARKDIGNLIGCFVNTLALRLNLAGKPPLRVLMQRVREILLRAYAHQDLPFEQVVDLIRPIRALSRNPLVQILFILQKSYETDFSLPALSLTPLTVDSGTAKFDITFSLEECERGLKGTVEYNTDLFTQTTIQRLITHFQLLLESAVADPTQRLTELPLLTPQEQQQIIGWNATARSYPSTICLHQAFEAQVARTPDVIAVAFEEQQLTYAELNRRANQLAHYLHMFEAHAEMRVGICMERSLAMVIGLLGILKAGGVYIPLDPTLPVTRLFSMLQDVEMELLLLQERFIPLFEEIKLPLICLDKNRDAIAQYTEENPSYKVVSDNLAYVIYTSGSTGAPKGVMNTHSGVYNRLMWMQDTYELKETDRVLQKTPFGFDVSVWEFFWPLLTGAQLILARPEGHRDSRYLLSLIVQQSITTLHFVPSMLYAFLKEQDIKQCRSIQRIFCSGEILPVELQRACLKLLKAQLYNLYGPTEAAIDVTAWPCMEEEQQTIPIGYPISNTSIYLLNEQLQQVPIRAVGDLYIGGAGVARGYYGESTLTAEKFIPDLFSSVPGSRMYKTGDKARYREDGCIEFIGRSDFQVKIRGCRVELGEVEAALQKHTMVRQAVVLAKEYGPADKRLVAYIIPRSELQVSQHELRTFLLSKLPDYAIPTSVVALQSFPQTPNGKVDRKALSRLEISKASLSSAQIPPHSALEHTIVEIWREVLHCDTVSINENFFDIGGHSLLLIEVRQKLMETLGQEITLADLFRYPSIQALATYFTERDSARLSEGITRAKARKRSLALLKKDSPELK
ncbi:non-ribosomal peptide synthetase [Reticulibacter mediterranei]|uniref:Non-ribosomal peptide synthetase n=1 Tax=Reticulibacter mediterranei TaxID=2778369 RepID=A0A8J3N6F0_9CHLR|nr:non-ribosomal peptide synthetase [Reticulibacter mediterranei]GHO97478.1 non-ribosomal peptide synthetase [Reticulibacter mediterranei]